MTIGIACKDENEIHSHSWKPEEQEHKLGLFIPNLPRSWMQEKSIYQLVYLAIKDVKFNRIIHACTDSQISIEKCNL